MARVVTEQYFVTTVVEARVCFGELAMLWEGRLSPVFYAYDGYRVVAAHKV